MPLPTARTVVEPVTDMDALLAAGWDVQLEEGDAGATVTLSRPTVFTGATAAEALAAARAWADAGGGA